jgi:glycosyltransferase involved in cell wall biosynthesis
MHIVEAASAPSNITTMTEQPLVSVVTPVHNGERYLRRCIESVIAQSHVNWDYTIVNNCSTDGTLDMALEYASRDRRIRVHNNSSFLPINANYNMAFHQISPQSKYCKVVAADDWLGPDCLTQMVRVAEEHPSVAIVGAYGLKGARVEWIGLPYPSTVVPGRVPARLRLLEGKDVFGAPTAVLYRSDIIRSRDPFFDESNFHADSRVCLEILARRDYGFVHQVLTFRRDEDENSMGAVSEEFKTIHFAILGDLVACGRNFLSEQELRDRTREHLRDYYRFLGINLFKGRNRQFWKLHQEKLAEAGHPLSRTRLAMGALAYLANIALNPMRSCEKLAERFSSRVRHQQMYRLESGDASVVFRSSGL